MRYNGPFVSLGNTGLKVSRIAFGCGFRGLPDVKDAQKVVEQAMDTGINFIDCANRYECANSVKAEVALGNALKGRRDDFVITSKVGTPQGNGPNSAGLSRGHYSSRGRKIAQKAADRLYRHLSAPYPR